MIPPPPRPVRMKGRRLALVAGSTVLSIALLSAFFLLTQSRNQPAWFWPAYLACLAPAFAWMASQVSRERALAARGVVAAATVTGYLPEAGSGRYYRPPGVTFEFRTGDGVVVHGQSRSLKLGKARTGEKLPALYDPARPMRHRLAADLVWVEI